MSETFVWVLAKGVCYEGYFDIKIFDSRLKAKHEYDTIFENEHGFNEKISEDVITAELEGALILTMYKDKIH